MKEYVKIKVVSLAEEAKLIRREANEAKWKARAAKARAKYDALQSGKILAGAARSEAVVNGLTLHRRREVRREARSAHLAYGFLKGLGYFQMEQFAWEQPDWNRVKRLVMKYGEGDGADLEARFDAWMSNALRGTMPYLVDKDKRTPHSRRIIDNWVRSRPLANYVIAREESK